ncbi:MAG: Ig-like domain-containing protein, partial [Thermoanaerobaculia bacterium]
HRIDFDIRATLRQSGQTDLPLRATPSASIVVHDPRFNINFSHPDTVREGIEYSTYAFVTNMSAAEQSITITSGVESCDVIPSANVCRFNGVTTDLLTIPAGEMRLVEYRLRAGVTGQVFATAGTIGNTDNLSASVRLHMGVSDTSIPLSPATLILPHYAQYVSPDVVSANLQLFGLGYSLATAPLNAMTAKFPRVIKTDVFQRAVDVARAGQRIFITDDAPAAKRDSIAHLALDLLGNGGYELRQWDELRRQEKSGRLAGAAVVRELETIGLADGATMTSFFDNFATATAHRQGFVAALAHGSATGDRPYAVSFNGRTTGRRSDVPNEAGSDWVRGIPFSDISRFNGAGETGELGLVGRWTEDLDVVVTPAQDGTFSLELIYPDGTDGSLKRAHFEIPGMRNRKVTISLTRGASSLNAMGDAGIAAVGTVTTVQPAPLSIDAARQDLHLDEHGHKVSILFNRPVAAPDGVDLRTKFTGAIDFNRDGVVYQGPRPIAAAALQEDGRTVNLTFDHSLSQNATYTIDTATLVDPVSNQSVSFSGHTVPKIDNDLPGGVIYGKVLKGDNTPIFGADVVLRQYEPYIPSAEPTGAPQYDVSQSDGAFLFEWVRRQTDLGWNGAYRLEAFSTVHKTTSVEGSVRLPGKVHFVNLQYLGRGAAEGTVRYDNGEIAAGVAVVVGSTMFNQFRTTAADANGFYRVEDLPVGPLTFSARDSAGNVTYAASEVSTAGQLVTQNLSIYRQPFPGTGRVHGTVRRSDTSEPMAGVHVGVYSQGYGFVDGYTDSAGRFSFDRIPAGFVTVLAEEWSVARQSVAVDFDLQPNEIRQADLLFLIQPAMQTTTLTGQVLRENPLQPGVQEKVPGALVKISGYRIVTADAEGRFIYENLPVALSNRTITAYDPETKRVKDAVVPTLTESGPNHVAIFINAFDRGSGIIRVRLLNGGGSPVSGYRVIVPGYPPEVLSEVGNGVYELHDVPVGSPFGIWAVPVGFRPENGQPDPRPYGDQMANGKATVAFNGHIAPLTLRLPGEGTVRVWVRSQSDLIAPVHLSYSVWDEAQQRTSSFGIDQSSAKNGEADAAVFTRIPALTGGYTVSSAHPQYGSAGLHSILAFDGDLQTHHLQLNTLATVSGTVYAIDGVTPVAGASVTISNGRSDPGTQLTGPDGRFSFPDQPSNLTVTVTAQITQSGIYRTGEASARTPVNGGAVENLSVVLRKRGFVEGLVVYKDYKHFDPDNVANNVPDDTPGDYSDNAPVPLAKFHLRELDFPRRNFGTAATPLTADITGRFILNNVFVGSLRATAWDSGNEELRGDWSGRIDEEGQEATPRAYIPIGDGGAGALTVRVVDPNQNHAEVPNADVSLYRSGSLFDFTTTGPTGAAELTEIPVGTYSVSAYSKSLGKTSTSVSVTITRDASASIQLQLEFSGSVDGTLTDPEESDTPVPGAHVRLTGSNYATQATTDVQGSFEFLGVREGAFRLDAKDTNTNRRASAERVLSMLDPHRTVNLELEPIETLHFAAYLPDDFGNRSTVFAPPTRVSVHQRGDDYERELHGNPLQFPGLFEGDAYEIRIWQAGDQHPSIVLPGAFPTGTAANPFVYVFPAFGEVRVTVTQDGGPAAGARVTIYGTGTNVTVYTDDTGLAIARGVRLGNLNVQAQSLDQHFTGSVGTTLQRQSVPATATITLGTYTGVTGYVEAEAGGPSIGTRVIASYGAHVGEIRTDANGRYTFLGIPAPPSGSLRVNLTFVGPDDVTVGAYGSKDVKAGDGIVEAASVRLDATQPLIESILPEDGAVDVSPDASITIAFSEPLNPVTLIPGNLQLVAADGSGAVTCSITSRHLDGGKFAVVMKPPAAASGLPLRSNTLYRVIVTQGVQDLTGHKLPAPRAFAFTTSDYAEPRVVKVLPPSPIPAATTFEFRFNEPIDPAPWATGGSGVFHLDKLLPPGGSSAAVERELVARAFLDPVTNMTLFIAPDDANPILPDSFYRVFFSGVRDPQGNVLGEQTFHFSSFDEIAPHVVFVAPAAGEQLVSGAEYEIRVDLRNGSASGSTATDVTKVEYFIVAAGGTETPFTTITKPPFAVKVLGPEAPPAGATFTVGAQAVDTSGNRGPKSTTSWTVKPNAAPVNVMVTPLAASAYPSTQIGGIVTFDDEGSFVTVTMNFAVPRSNGTVETRNVTQSYSRLANGSWPEARFVHTLPNDASAGENATLAATVVDVRGLASAPASATVAITADVAPPTIVSVSPLAGTAFFNRDRFAVEAIVSDAETGVQSVTFFVDGKSYAVASSEVGPAPGTRKFRSVEIEARSKAEDVNVSIVVMAKDWNGNTASQTHDVIYKAVDDPNAPKVTWLCPIDGAAIPALTSGFTLDLRASVVDEDVQSVKFLIGSESTSVDATHDSGSLYRATYTFAQTPAAGSLEITVVVEDTVATHRVELPITLEVVAVDHVYTQSTPIVAADAAALAGKSIAVIGPSALLVPHVPLALENLLVLQGGRVSTLATGTEREFRLDVTTTGVTYVDCASSIDVTGKGYAGGFSDTLDGPNDDRRGFTVGNTLTGGAVGTTWPALGGASASHAGVGGSRDASTPTNAVYGSISQPTDLGAGGGGYQEGTVRHPGGSGGGAIRLRGGAAEDDPARIVVAGRLVADGDRGASRAGAGGSVWMDAKQIVVGANARVSANGADDDIPNARSSGAGGGRIAIAARIKLDVHAPALEARGGRHPAGEVQSYIGGGAGTIFVRKPGQARGELIASSYDTRFPSSQQLTLPLPIGRIGGGTSTAVAANALTDASRTFDRWMIREKLVLGGDTSRAFTVVGISADAHSLLTDPADGSLLDLATSQNVEYAGLLSFDKVTAGPRALLVFDNHLDVGGAVDAHAALSIDPTAIVLLRGDEPVLTVNSTPAVGANLIRETTLSFSYGLEAIAGLTSTTVTWPFDATPRVEAFFGYPRTVSRSLSLPVPADAPLGPATVTITATDRSGRTYGLESTYTVVENSAPVVTSFTVAPSLSIHAGRDVVASVTATDDLAVKTMAFEAKLNGASIKTQSFSLSATEATRQFTVPVANDVGGGSTLEIQVSVSDGFAGRPPTLAAQTVTILPDATAPQLTMLAPAAGTIYRETIDKIEIRATAVDAEVGVREVLAQVSGTATPTPLARVGSTNEWRAEI